MKKNILLLLSILVINSAFSQKSWKYKYYKTINYTNYKTYKMVNAQFNKDNPDIPLLDAIILFMTNEIRVKHNLKTVEYSEELEIMAYQHSKRMSEKDFFSHYDKTSKKRKEPSDRAKLAGIDNPYIAENIAYSSFEETQTYYEIAKILMDMWMKSKGHRENILSKDALQGGCAVYISNDVIYGTQNYQWFKLIVKSERKDALPEVK